MLIMPMRCVLREHSLRHIKDQSRERVMSKKEKEYSPAWNLDYTREPYSTILNCESICVMVGKDSRVIVGRGYMQKGRHEDTRTL